MKRIGEALDVLGQVGFPLVLGAALGFWIADLGTPWLPDMLAGLSVWALISLLFIAIGKVLRDNAAHLDDDLELEDLRRMRVRKRVVAALVATPLAAGLWLFAQESQDPSPLTELSPADFDTAWQQDLESYRELDRGLERLLLTLHAEQVWADDQLSDDHERLLASAWVSFYDQAFALDALRAGWEDWWRFDPSRQERDQHVSAFLLGFTAELALYEKTARLTSEVLDKPNAKKFLDNPHPELGPDSFSHLRSELLGTRDRARLAAARQYLEGLERVGVLRSPTSRELLERAEHHLAVIQRVAPTEAAEIMVRADSQTMKRVLRRAWFPTRRGVAEWMGDVKLRRIGWYLIPDEQVAELEPQLLPGDVMLSRKNWYLSNVGLPGYWPHAILYIGDPEKLRAYADDTEVLAWLEEETGEALTFPEYMARRYPVHWLRYLQGDGDPHRVIEAVGEGTILNTLEHAAGDYLAAIRPHGTKLQRVQAVAAAFDHLDKPYDWDFDFATDHAVVCSEVVWRSWRTAGVDWPTQRVVGRDTYPPTLFVEQWRDGGPFDFVAFIDAREAERETFFSDEAALRATPDRPKWDLFQE